MAELSGGLGALRRAAAGALTRLLDLQQELVCRNEVRAYPSQSPTCSHACNAPKLT
jgi:hypothetical protein